MIDMPSIQVKKTGYSAVTIAAVLAGKFNYGCSKCIRITLGNY
jgi:hypothetical protein